MKKIKNIFVVILLSVSFFGNSQDTAKAKIPKQEAGFDIFFLACGDTAGSYYERTTGFKNLGDEQWAASSLGFSLHYYYKMKYFSIGGRAGLMENQELFTTWIDSKPSTAIVTDRTLISKHSKIFISPTIKFEKKIKWLFAGFSFEVPFMFNDRIKSQMDYNYSNYNSTIKDTLLSSGSEHWKETIKSGVSIGTGMGMQFGLMISKKIKMELSVNEYYFFISTTQRVERNGTYDEKILQSGSYANYSGTTAEKSEMNLRSGKFSKLSARLSFSYKF